MPHDPTSDSRTASRRYDPVDLARRLPSLQPSGAYSKLPPIPLHKPITLLGSRRTARIHLNSSSVSRAHALFVVHPDAVILRDLHSREGTYVNGRPVDEQVLSDGDEISIGRFTFAFRDPRPLDSVQVPEIEPAVLQVDSPAGSQTVELRDVVTLIGRRTGSDVELRFPDVSTANTALVRLKGYHAEKLEGGLVGYAVFDLGGKGTRLDGRPVARQVVDYGDSIGIGPATLRLAPAPASEQAVSLADEDDIALQEELLSDGSDADLLGGSYVMPAVAEPEARDEAPAAPAATEPSDSAPAWPRLAEDSDEPVESPTAHDTTTLSSDEVGETEVEPMARGWRQAGDQAPSEPVESAEVTEEEVAEDEAETAPVAEAEVVADSPADVVEEPVEEPALAEASPETAEDSAEQMIAEPTGGAIDEFADQAEPAEALAETVSEDEATPVDAAVETETPAVAQEPVDEAPAEEPPLDLAEAPSEVPTEAAAEPADEVVQPVTETPAAEGAAEEELVEPTIADAAPETLELAEQAPEDEPPAPISAGQPEEPEEPAAEPLDLVEPAPTPTAQAPEPQEQVPDEPLELAETPESEAIEPAEEVVSEEQPAAEIADVQTEDLAEAPAVEGETAEPETPTEEAAAEEPRLALADEEPAPAVHPDEPLALDLSQLDFTTEEPRDKRAVEAPEEPQDELTTEPAARDEAEAAAEQAAEPVEEPIDEPAPLFLADEVEATEEPAAGPESVEPASAQPTPRAPRRKGNRRRRKSAPPTPPVLPVIPPEPQTLAEAPAEPTPEVPVAEVQDTADQVADTNEAIATPPEALEDGESAVETAEAEVTTPELPAEPAEERLDVTPETERLVEDDLPAAEVPGVVAEETAEAMAASDDALETAPEVTPQADFDVASDVEAEGETIAEAAPEAEITAGAFAESESALAEEIPAEEVPTQAAESAGQIGLEDSLEGTLEETLAETQPTPESALDLGDLGEASHGDWNEAPVGSLPSNESFARQLGALGDSVAGDLVEAPEAESLSASDLDDIPAAEAPSEQVTADSVKPVEAAAPVEPEAQQPIAEATTEAPADTSAKEEGWLDDWQTQQSAFLGNIQPLDLSGLPVDAPLPEEARPAAEHAPEARPEGLSERPADKAPGRSPGVPTARPPAPRKPAPRPRTIGFGEPAPPREQQPGSHTAGPFSSAPLGLSGAGAVEGAESASDEFGGGFSGLDPSGVIPETSGLVGTADVFSLQTDAEPQIPELNAPTALADQGSAAVAEPATPSRDTTAEAWTTSRSTDREADEPLADEDADQMGALLQEAPVDGFLQTVRAGVPKTAGTNGYTNGHANGHHTTGRDLGDDLAAPSPTIPRQRPAQPPRTRRAPRRTRPPIDAFNGPGGPEAALAEPVDFAGGGRRSVWLVPLLVGLMVVSMIGAVVGIYFGLTPTTPVTVKLRYDIPDTLSVDQRRNYQQDQRRLLDSPAVREASATILSTRYPEIGPGFLSDPLAWDRFAESANWSPTEPETLVLQRQSADRQGDIARLKAVAQALYELSSADRGDRQKYEQELRGLQREIGSLQGDVETLTRNIEEAAATLPDVPSDPTAMAMREQELQQQINRLTTEWNDADRRVSNLREQIEALRGTDPYAGDSTLTALREELARVQQQIETLRPASQQTAGDGVQGAAIPASGVGGVISTSRADLNQSLKRLREAAAQAAADLEPVVATALRDDVEQLAQTLSVVIDDTLPVQMSRAGDVALAREKLERIRTARLEALVAADEELQTLRSQADLAQRELNAALSDGLTNEAKRLRLRLSLIQDRAAVREQAAQEALATDPANLHAMSQLSEVERRARAQIEQDAADVAKRLAALSAACVDGAASDPAVTSAVHGVEEVVQSLVRQQASRMPLVAAAWAQVWPTEEATSPDDPVEEADSLVEEPWGVQSQVFADFAPGAARQAGFAQAAPAASLRELRAQAAQLQRQIEQREAELRGERETQLLALTQQLTAAQAAADKARREAQQARTELSELQSGRETAERQRQRLAELRSRKADREQEIQERQRQSQILQQNLDALAVPRPPSDADISAPLPEDNRWQLSLAAFIGIFALFLIPIYFTLRRE